MNRIVFCLAALAAVPAVAGGAMGGFREIPCPQGTLSAVVRAPRIPESKESFTVAFRFRAPKYETRDRHVKEGLVFVNGNGWDNGFRATMTPEVNHSLDGYRMALRVAGEEHAAHVSLNGVLAPDCWHSLAFAFGDGKICVYHNGALSASCKFAGRFKKPSCGFSIGPAGFGVGYHPFEAADFRIYDRTLTCEEALALVTGGKTAPRDVKVFLEGLDEASFAGMRSLAWNTARRLAEGGARKDAASLYGLLASRAPANPTIDGGNVTAAHFARIFGGVEVAPAVKPPDIVPFAGYGAFADREFRPDVAKATFVAPGGDDKTGDGSAARPFATIGRALAAVLGKAERVILLKGGRYMLSEGVKIEAADSGEADAPLVIAAAPGETPVLDGGREVKGLAPCGRGGILAADLRGQGFEGVDRPFSWGYAMGKYGTRHIIDLYEDDEPCELARYPNDGFLPSTWADPTNLLFKVDLPDLVEWAKETDLFALAYMRRTWGDETVQLKIDAAAGTLQLDTNVVKKVKTGRPVKILNAVRAIDEPGEWALDHAAGRLYLKPRRMGSRVVLSQLAEPLISIDGARHVEIRGLTLQHGRSNGIRAEKCSHVRIIGNAVRNLGSGIFVKGEDIVIAGNRMTAFSHGGISAYGGDRRALRPSGIRILRNNISNVERKVRTYCPCVHADGVGMEIAFNHFHDAPSSAVRLEGNDILLNSNLVENCVLESDDQGAVDIYANPTYAGIEIIGNVWRDIGRGGPFVPVGQAAIRFDDIISGVKVRLNRFYNCGYAHFGAVQINGGRLNVVDNNLFVDCRKDCSVNIRRPEWWKKTMTTGYASAKIAAVKPTGEPWRSRYPYLVDILGWPCMNFISRNVAVRTPRTRRPPGENGNIVLSAEPTGMPVGYDALPPLTR